MKNLALLDQRKEEPKKISEMTIDELKDLLGDFEDRYSGACVGDRVSHPILGRTYQGIIDFALAEKAIVIRNKNYYVRHDIYHNWWRPKFEARQELQCRREYAKKCELKGLDEIAKSFPKLEEESEGINVDKIPF